MAGVSEKGGVADAPVGVVVHVLELPRSEVVRVGEREEAFCDGVEVAVDAKSGVEGDLLIVRCVENESMSKIRRKEVAVQESVHTNDSRRIVVVGSLLVGEMAWISASYVELAVVVDRIHEDALIVAFPREHVHVVFDNGRHDTVALHDGFGEHESNSTLTSGGSGEVFLAVQHIWSDSGLGHDRSISNNGMVEDSENISRTCSPSAAMIKSAETVVPSASDTAVFSTSADTTLTPSFTSTPLSLATRINC